MTRLDAAVAELVAALREEIAAGVSGPTRLFSVEEAAIQAGIGRSLAYGLIRQGELRSVKVGRRRLVPADALVALAQGTAGAPSSPAALEVDR